MVFDVRKASDWDYESRVNINTLEELLAFIESQEHDAVLERSYMGYKTGTSEKVRCPWKIRIYDDYLD